ncbi:transposase [Okeania sp. SIO2C9]|uniref:transposase n=1 Tax=Okeania sp. SIO2C9 TaxID=2607791 RepID=UPI00345DDBE0
MIGSPMRRSPSGERGSSTNVEIKIQLVKLDKTHALSIDHGLDNWLTCVDTLGHSFIVDGKHLKSKNQWYNKQIAALKENQPQGFWSKRLARITEKRDCFVPRNQMRDAVNMRSAINHQPWP